VRREKEKSRRRKRIEEMGVERKDRGGIENGV
jgi:hypothetical protein